MNSNKWIREAIKNSSARSHYLDLEWYNLLIEVHELTSMTFDTEKNAPVVLIGFKWIFECVYLTEPVILRFSFAGGS